MKTIYKVGMPVIATAVIFATVTASAQSGQRAAKGNMRIAITGAERTLLCSQRYLKALRHDEGVILDFSQTRDAVHRDAKRLAFRVGAHSAP